MFVDFQIFLQFSLATFSSLAILSFILVWRPLESELFTNLAIFNEVMLVVIGYSLYLFTDYVPEVETRYEMGKVLLSLVYFNIGVNFFVVVIEVYKRTMVQARYFYKKLRSS